MPGHLSSADAVDVLQGTKRSSAAEGLVLLCPLQVRLHCGLQHENIISLYAAWQEAGNVVLLQVRTVTGAAAQGAPRIHRCRFTPTAQLYIRCLLE